MPNLPINSTGWTQLFNGDLIGAATVLYSAALYGWAFTILYFVFQIMLFIKNKNASIMFVMDCIFWGAFITIPGFASVFNINAIYVMIFKTVLTVGAVLFWWLWK